ncbi:hypothetical protein C8R43DRAFT_1244587 [Mycena crocata]|nr:hypothetical protein C8R43DRAFT_1244587 [Mycena crocata]
MPLQRLSADLRSLFAGKPVDFAHPVFANTTHLCIFPLMRDDATEWTAVAQIPHLTHLAFHTFKEPTMLHNVLRACTNLCVLVYFYFSTSTVGAQRSADLALAQDLHRVGKWEPIRAGIIERGRRSGLRNAGLGNWTKLAYFSEHWSAELQAEVLVTVEKIFERRWLKLRDAESDQPVARPRKKTKLAMLLAVDLDSDSEDDSPVPSSSAIIPEGGKPWFADFRKYIDALDDLPDNMSVVTWWGCHD